MKKKSKLYIEDKSGRRTKQEVDYGVVFGAKGDDMTVSVVGESTFEEMNNLIYSGLAHLYESSASNFGEDKRKEIYDRAVQMFSLVMDKFYPEAAKSKYGILTDEDIKKAEDAKVDSLYKSK